MQVVTNIQFQTGLIVGLDKEDTLELSRLILSYLIPADLNFVLCQCYLGGKYRNIIFLLLMI